MSGRYPERIDPLFEPGGVTAHHLKKYEFARPFPARLRIDVACGVGYGTAYLGELGGLTLGLELDYGAVRLAHERYAGARTRFMRGDAEGLPFTSEVADLVTCFEAIEHFFDPAAAIAEASRVLSKGGIYLVSTPRRGARTQDEQLPENPHHLREFSADEFYHLLTESFREVHVLGQRRLQTETHLMLQRLDLLGFRKRRYLRPAAKLLSRAVGTAPVDEATLDDFVIDYRIHESLDLVAVCSEPVR